MFHKISVRASWYIPTQLDTGIPASVELTSWVTVQVPQHASIHVTTVDLDCLENLEGISKAKSLPYTCAILNQAPSLTFAVIVKIAVLV